MEMPSKSPTTLINANTYRSDGQRISKYEHGQTINYIYFDGSVLYTTDTDSNPINFYLTTPDGQLLAWQHFDTDGTHFSGLTTDIRQSTNTVLGESGSFLTGFRYTDFGETTRSLVGLTILTILNLTLGEFLLGSIEQTG